MPRIRMNGGGISSRLGGRRIERAAQCAVETLETRVMLSVSVTNYHYNQSETGANTNETILTPANVNSLTFGKIASLPVDGQVYAQPLIMTGVSVPAVGTEDLVFVATEGDSVYAFKADGSSTTPVWKMNMLQSGETTIPYGDVGTTDIMPQIGITGTPVIDTTTNTLYVVGNFKETATSTYQQRLYALDITTGAVKYGGPVVITATVNGTGAGSSGGKLSFGAQLENQRPGLTIDNGNVYIAFASHGDNGNYHGWVIAYNETTLVQDYVWCNTPNASQGGIWMSGGAPAVDSSGNLYLTSGNGSFDVNTGGKDYGMTLTKLSPTLQPLDYFSPYNESSLSNADEDYGCGNAVLLSGQTGSAPNEAITLGKWGGVYLNNTATGSMGEINNPPNGPNNDLGEAATGLQQHNTFSYWNGEVYITPDGGKLRDYAVGNSTMSATATSQSAHVFGVGGANGQGSSPTISANGNTNGIVWCIENVAFNNGPAILYAYDATDLTHLLYASNQYGTRDTAGTAVKFTTPVVANGLVYVGGGGSVTIYGNIPPAPPPPPPPPPMTGATGFSGPITLNSGGSSAGVPSVSADNNTLTLTTAVGAEASSAFFNAPALLNNFTASFTYQETGTGPADGITFTLQNSGSGDAALGAGGGALGYNGITPSFAVEFNIYQTSSTGVATNGVANQTHALSNTGSVNLASGDPINVNLAYNSQQWTLTETLTDTKTNATYSTVYSDINLSTLLGVGTDTGTTDSAYMGFTGGTGGAWALQTVSNFKYSTSANEPSFPTLPAGATSVSGFANNFLNGVNTDPAGAPSVSADNNTLTVTTATNTEATSAFNKTPVEYGNFNASFTYTGSGTADGMAFTLQDEPGLNQTGGQLGYGPALPDSFAVEFNIYQVSSTSIGAGGAVTVPYTGNTGGVNLASGDPINVNLQYSSSAQTLTEKLTDSTTAATDTITYKNINLRQILGNSPSTYVGFSGGTGGANALQTISGFTYTANTTLPAVPVGPQVNLTGYFNSYGIANVGNADVGTGNPTGGLFPVAGNGTTAYDGGGSQLNEAYIGASKAVTDGNGNTQTFNFGPVPPAGTPSASGTANVVDAVGQTINLPQGKYGNLSILGSAANGAQQDQPFSVNYTDGTSQTFTPSLSDWWYPGATFPGESVALSMPDHLDGTGAVAGQGAGQPIDIYEYQFALNPAKTVSSISLPINDNVKILAINVNPAPNIVSISPNTGPAAGGTTVTLNGNGFTGATAVDFGSTPATSFTVNAAGTQIVAVDPAGSGTVDVTVTGPYGTSLTGAGDQFTYINSFPAWLSPSSAATWNASTHTLTVTGSATIISDPGTDEPNIVASGSAAKLAITPATSPTDVHIGGATLSSGASITMTSVGSGRSHSNHNVLVIGAAGAANDPTVSIDSSSKIDLTDNDMVVHTGTSDTTGNSELTAWRALAQTGRGVPAGSVLNGTWTGNGLTSSSAASVDSKAGYEQNVLAVVLNSDQILGSDSKWTVGSSSETLGSHDILVKYTYNGDAALEGYVGDDSVTIVNGLYDGGRSYQPDWAFGDFTGSSTVNDNDITILNGLYGNGTASSGLPQL